jgi:Putative peptidoglycan binding domain
MKYPAIGVVVTAIIILSSAILPAGLARASASASIVGLYPNATIPIGTTVSFIVEPSGFTNPSYWVVDSFPGGVTTTNINAAGDLSWTPNIDDVGTHNITVTVSDSAGNSAAVSQQIVVNGAPTISLQSLTPGSSVVVGTPVSFTVVPSGFINQYYYSAADSFSHSSLQYSAVNSTTNVFSWTPVAQDVGNHTITITAKDNFGYLATTSQQITVLGVPTVSIESLLPGSSVGVGQPLSFIATSTGLTNPTYTVEESLTGASTSTVAIDPSSGVASWTPTYNDIGVHQVAVNATDSTGVSATTTVAITVTSQPQGSTVYSVAPVSTPSVTTTTSVSTAAPAISPAYVFKRYLTVGSVGSDVTALQDTLTAQGSYSGPITGYFGQLTMRGVEVFQKIHGIEVVGAVGPLTRKVLNQL